MSPVSTRPTEVRPLAFSDGAPANLGRELGRGGEGVVHELPAHAEWVAKLYHQAPDAAKQQKLRLMAESIDSPLRNYAAWPEETLHLGENGPVIGFTMQRIEGRLPIHMLYSPAQRRESFAQARFDFLVFVARNIAAAFATLHEHGHVLGDVNQGNVLVGADSRVILIDCDSFQIQVGEALHRCEVGVAHFTPPELQSIASFEDITRTPNHDAFGLALLIFHLLMGGRHPYSGVPLADHIGESLEADIRDFRYAYAKDAAQRLIAPPPKSVPIDSLPPAIVALFEQAFTEPGVDARPTPQQWVGALDALRAQLQACAKNPLHVHAGVTGECVWCGLDRRHVVFFGAANRDTRPLSAAAAAASKSVDLDLAAMEADVAAMTLPEPLRVPSLPALPLPPRDEEVESSALGRGLIFGLPSAALGAATAIHALATPAVLGMTMLGAGIPIAMITGFISWRVLARRADDYREASRTFRLLHDAVSDRVEEINEAVGVGRLDQWRKAERRLREFRTKEASALATFKMDASEAGLRTFLRSQLTERWRDPRVSLAERIRLRAAGIETAADFDKAKLAKLHLLGDDARAALLSWKQGMIVEYRRKTPAATPELAEFMAWRSKQQRELEERLLEAFEKLQKRQQPGSLVLQARLNQLADLERDLHAQYQKCLKLAAKLPKSDNAGSQRN